MTPEQEKASADLRAAEANYLRAFGWKQTTGNRWEDIQEGRFYVEHRPNEPHDVIVFVTRVHDGLVTIVNGKGERSQVNLAYFTEIIPRPAAYANFATIPQGSGPRYTLIDYHVRMR